MDEFETRDIVYALMRLNKDQDPRECIKPLEGILEEYDFYRLLTFNSNPQCPKAIYSSDGKGAIFVSYGCCDIDFNSICRCSKNLQEGKENSIFLLPLSVEDYVFDKLLRDLTNGEYEEAEPVEDVLDPEDWDLE